MYANYHIIDHELKPEHPYLRSIRISYKTNMPMTNMAMSMFVKLCVQLLVLYKPDGVAAVSYVADHIFSIGIKSKTPRSICSIGRGRPTIAV